jgi:uncharacterized membrane protein YcaP (DUF421 family)
MQVLFDSAFGSGSDLTIAQMSFRGVVVFFLTLSMLRISGRRSFGQHSAFDACITVLLGSILARAVVGASPFAATIFTGVAIVLLHRGIAMASIRMPLLEKVISGSPRTLVRDGTIDVNAAHRGLVSEADIGQALREQASMDDIAKARRVTLERNGIISVVTPH